MKKILAAFMIVSSVVTGLSAPAAHADEANLVVADSKSDSVGQQIRLANPSINIDGTVYRIDWCYLLGDQCGAPAADAYCKFRHFRRAVDQGRAPAFGVTWVPGVRQVCGPQCDAFEYIICQQ